MEEMRIDLVIACLVGMGLGFIFSIQPTQECKPIEIIKWFEPETIVVQPPFGRPESDWLQQFERAAEEAPVFDRPVYSSSPEVEEPRRHHRWRHRRRGY
jgi:hypothetical protein